MNNATATPEVKKAPIRVVFCDGKAVALVRARSEAQAVRHVTRHLYEAPIADQEHLILYAPKFTVEDSTHVDGEAAEAEKRG